MKQPGPCPGQHFLTAWLHVCAFPPHCQLVLKERVEACRWRAALVPAGCTELEPMLQDMKCRLKGFCLAFILRVPNPRGALECFLLH